MTGTTTDLTPLVERVQVESVTRLSPGFVRFELGSPALADFGVDGPLYDQRIKLVFPNQQGALPDLEVGGSWYARWCELSEQERGHLRTYTVRDVVGTGAETRLVVDIVLHPGDPEHPTGPGAAWAARAEVGQELIVIAPRRGVFYGGIEWAPAPGQRLLLAADETALPAVAGILAGLDDDAVGAAYVEVPQVADFQQLSGPSGVSVTWIAREAASHGERLHAAVVGHLGGESARVAVEDAEIDPALWETPAYSSSGEQVVQHATTVGHDLDGLYAWIAGESRAVTGLRRVLVKELGVDRSQVAFMGYWRIGVAMKG